MPHKELSKLSAARLQRFMQRHGYNAKKAGEALGVSERMIYKYLVGQHQIPQTIYLLIKALETE